MFSIEIRDERIMTHFNEMRHLLKQSTYDYDQDDDNICTLFCLVHSLEIHI